MPQPRPATIRGPRSTLTQLIAEQVEAIPSLGQIGSSSTRRARRTANRSRIAASSRGRIAASSDSCRRSRRGWSPSAGRRRALPSSRVETLMPTPIRTRRPSSSRPVRAGSRRASGRRPRRRSASGCRARASRSPVSMRPRSPRRPSPAPASAPIRPSSRAQRDRSPRVNVRLPASDHHGMVPRPRPRVCRSAQTQSGSATAPCADQLPRRDRWSSRPRRGRPSSGRRARARHRALGSRRHAIDHSPLNLSSSSPVLTWRPTAASTSATRPGRSA